MREENGLDSIAAPQEVCRKLWDAGVRLEDSCFVWVFCYDKVWRVMTREDHPILLAMKKDPDHLLPAPTMAEMKRELTPDDHANTEWWAYTLLAVKRSKDTPYEEPPMK